VWGAADLPLPVTKESREVLDEPVLNVNGDERIIFFLKGRECVIPNSGSDAFIDATDALSSSFSAGCFTAAAKEDAQGCFPLLIPENRCFLIVAQVEVLRIDHRDAPPVLCASLFEDGCLRERSPLVGGCLYRQDRLDPELIWTICVKRKLARRIQFSLFLQRRCSWNNVPYQSIKPATMHSTRSLTLLVN